MPKYLVEFFGEVEVEAEDETSAEVIALEEHADSQLRNGQSVDREPKSLYWWRKMTSPTKGTNPKDLIGVTKVSISKFPVIGTIMGAMAMMLDGADKYGPYNWRGNKVVASIYVDAAKRHMDCWFEGQENAGDSKVHHLGHAIACCAILLDAQVTGNLVDDRPPVNDPDWLEKFLAKLTETIKEKKSAVTKEK